MIKKNYIDALTHGCVIPESMLALPLLHVNMVALTVMIYPRSPLK